MGRSGAAPVHDRARRIGVWEVACKYRDLGSDRGYGSGETDGAGQDPVAGRSEPRPYKEERQDGYLESPLHSQKRRRDAGATGDYQVTRRWAKE
jgi:hypothetical protein